MPNVATRDVSLTLSIGGTAVECQLLDPEIVRPSYGAGDTETVACGDEVAVPGDRLTNGSITGNVIADYSTTGVTKVLDENLDAEVAVVWEETVNDGTTSHTRTWTGQALVGLITRTFTAGRQSRHDLNLELVSETSIVYATV